MFKQNSRDYDFEGYVNVGGMRANINLALPDPLSSANGEALLEDLFGLLAGTRGFLLRPMPKSLSWGCRLWRS